MWILAALALLALLLLTGEGVLVGLRWGVPVFLPLDRHVVVLGPTRSGKSRLAKKIVRRSGLPALILDWVGEYDLGLRVDARHLRYDLRGFDKKLLAEIIGLSLNLNEPSIYFLYRAVRNAEVKRIGDVLEALESFLVTSRAEVEMRAAIARRLEYIVEVLERGRVPLDLLLRLRRTVVIDLSRLRLYEEKVLVSLFVLALLYDRVQKEGVSRQPRKLLVVDEAQNVIKRGDVVRHLVFESAKFGLRVLLVTNEVPPDDVLVHSYIIITRPHMMYKLQTKRSALVIDNKVVEMKIV
ncbi:helicase HerA domain-containing protein [Pyrobaculum neutrophilum]|uniref:AAA ATPase n=1 Tax=Pyrobaculum neutrophilum (strain DSM 2338 / JCM 9278 / NBRC 100436 / V24Sta) TaxID=444157 RepID=B1YC89_PYRNV|nr:DUF87 domain-containing protein [Pyrobaculum neutrophilum]ACB39402.1 AAA ATPase [Pyrobaculum neutrophilum V24Sta]